MEDENISLEHKKTILDDLKKTYPGYYDELDEATLSTQTLEQANENLINSLLKASQVEALKGRLTEIQKEILDAQEDIGTSFLEDWGLTEGFTPLDLMLKTLSTTTGVEGIGNLNKEAEALTNILKNLMIETEGANEELKKLEHNTTDLINTTGIYSRALDPLIKRMEEYAKISTKMWHDDGILAGPMTAAEANYEKLFTMQDAWNDSVSSFGDIFSNSMQTAMTSQEDFFSSFIKNLEQAIVKQLAMLAAIEITGFLLGGIGGGMLTKGLPKGAGDFLRGIIPMADGGIVTGPQMALIGEAGPEAVIPLDQLKNFGGAQQVEVVGKISGTDIFLSNRNTGTNRQRSV